MAPGAAPYNHTNLQNITDEIAEIDSKLESLPAMDFEISPLSSACFESEPKLELHTDLLLIVVGQRRLAPKMMKLAEKDSSSQVFLVLRGRGLKISKNVLRTGWAFFVIL